MTLLLIFVVSLIAGSQGHSGHSHGLGTAEAIVRSPPEARARSMTLFVVGEQPAQEISNSADSNLVGTHPTIKDLLVRVSRHHRVPAEHPARHADGTDKSDEKHRTKRCSRCGGYGGGGNSVGLGGGVGIPTYSSGGGGYGGGYSSGLGGLSTYNTGGLGGGCGGGLCGGSSYSTPVVTAVQTRPVCSTCGGGGGGLSFNRPVYSQQSYQQPIYTQQSYQQPIYTQQYQQPIISRPIYTQQSYSQPTCSVCGGAVPAYSSGIGGFRSASSKSSASAVSYRK